MTGLAAAAWLVALAACVTWLALSCPPLLRSRKDRR